MPKSQLQKVGAALQMTFFALGAEAQTEALIAKFSTLSRLTNLLQLILTDAPLVGYSAVEISDAKEILPCFKKAEADTEIDGDRLNIVQAANKALRPFNDKIKTEAEYAKECQSRLTTYTRQTKILTNAHDETSLYKLLQSNSNAVVTKSIPAHRSTSVYALCNHVQSDILCRLFGQSRGEEVGTEKNTYHKMFQDWEDIKAWFKEELGKTPNCIGWSTQLQTIASLIVDGTLETIEAAFASAAGKPNSISCRYWSAFSLQLSQELERQAYLKSVNLVTDLMDRYRFNNSCDEDDEESLLPENEINELEETDSDILLYEPGGEAEGLGPIQNVEVQKAMSLMGEVVKKAEAVAGDADDDDDKEDAPLEKSEGKLLTSEHGDDPILETDLNAGAPTLNEIRSTTKSTTAASSGAAPGVEKVTGSGLTEAEIKQKRKSRRSSNLNLNLNHDINSNITENGQSKSSRSSLVADNIDTTGWSMRYPDPQRIAKLELDEQMQEVVGNNNGQERKPTDLPADVVLNGILQSYMVVPTTALLCLSFLDNLMTNSSVCLSKARCGTVSLLIKDLVNLYRLVPVMLLMIAVSNRFRRVLMPLDEDRVFNWWKFSCYEKYCHLSRYTNLDFLMLSKEYLVGLELIETGSSRMVDLAGRIRNLLKTSKKRKSGVRQVYDYSVCSLKNRMLNYIDQTIEKTFMPMINDICKTNTTDEYNLMYPNLRSLQVNIHYPEVWRLRVTAHSEKLRKKEAADSDALAQLPSAE